MPIEPRDTRWLDRLIALALILSATVALGVAQRNVGVTRDEGVYFKAGDAYFQWYAGLADNIIVEDYSTSLKEKEIRRFWSINHEHPGLFKSLAGASTWLLHDSGLVPNFPDGSPLLTRIGAARAPSWLFVGWALALLYLMGVHLGSRVAGFTAAAIYFTYPRLFFHGEIACFDSAITTLWLFVMYCYLRSLNGGYWGFLAALGLGAAMATKHNAWLLPPVLLVHYIFVVWPDLSFKPLKLPKIPLVFILMATVGPLAFFALWPWLWVDPIGHLSSYFAFHFNHAFYNIAYLGKNWGMPPLPISYPFGMLFFTMPLIVLVLSIGMLIHSMVPSMIGLLSQLVDGQPAGRLDPWRFPARRNWVRPAVGLNPRAFLLFGLSALVPIGVIALPWTPIFGGVKHFLPAVPFIALFAGFGLSSILENIALVSTRKTKLISLVAQIAVIAPGAVGIWISHPFELSQYSATAKSTAGAADLGLNRQYWGYATRAILPWLNENMPPEARVYFHDTDVLSHAAYVRDDLLRSDVKYAGMERPAIRRSDYAMVIHELHFNKYEYWIWDEYKTVTPEKVLHLDGVPLVSIYRRPLPKAAPRPQSQ